MAQVSRAQFLPDSVREDAGEDVPLPIGYGATCSQPSTVATMLQLLDVRPGHRVLDVGCGSGWTTALLHELCRPDGEVVGVELVPELAAQARKNLEGAGVTEVTVHEAQPEVLGWPAAAPFDRILVSAEAGELPPELVEQLTVPGFMVIPVGMTLEVVGRDERGVSRQPQGAYRFVPLR